MSFIICVFSASVALTHSRCLVRAVVLADGRDWHSGVDVRFPQRAELGAAVLDSYAVCRRLRHN